uniref:Uncharacterized protein n=1 Tax=Amphimedon queenslandica TaxID=400682 RepID=A0A1X7VAC2_AMPQE
MDFLMRLKADVLIGHISFQQRAEMLTMYMLGASMTIKAHSCSKPGCGSVIVMDANMKNHRDVCLATEAGFVEYDGLPGTVKTGCPNSPSYASWYCTLHKPLVVKSCPITCD